MKTLFVAPYVPSAANAIKIAALYFDEVVINERALIDCKPTGIVAERPITPGQVCALKFVVESVVSTVDDGLRDAIQPLMDEDIVRIETEPSIDLLRGPQRDRLRTEFGQSLDVLFSASDDLAQQKRTGLLEEGMAEIHSRFVGPVEAGAVLNTNAIATYFEGLFVEAIGAGLRGESVLSSSAALYRLVERAAASPALQSSKIAETFPNYLAPRLATDVIQASLMNLSTLDCCDVLEARFHLRDELIAFRSELDRLQFDFSQEFGIDKVFREGRTIAKARLSRRINEIEAKVRSAKTRAMRRLIEALERPGAYLPLAGHFYAGIPLEIALALSVGIISGRVALQALEERREASNDGLYYLVRMKSLFGNASRVTSTHGTTPVVLGENVLSGNLLAWPENAHKIFDSTSDDDIINRLRSMRAQRTF